MLGHGAQGQAHGQTDALAYDGPFQEDGFPHGGLFAGYDLIGQLLHAGVILVIGHFRHLGEDALAGIGDAASDVSHIGFLSIYANGRHPMDII